MNNRNNPYNDPWDQDIYETGSTQPPKSRGGFVSFLLMAVIFLCGVASAMSFMQIRLFDPNIDSVEPTTSVSFHNTSATGPTDGQGDPSSTAPAGEAGITIETSPGSVENTPQPGGLSLQEIYDRNIGSVVSISCKSASASASGTGVIISSKGYIVTNCHVVAGANSIQVLLTDGRTLAASLVGADEISDLAVLHVKADGLISAHLGDSGALRVGDLVVAIGDPLGVELRGTMTDGIVSAINRDITTGGRTMTLIQTNAALNAGNSGGPLINCYGQVIGINTMKIGDYMDSAGVEGLGFAIPSTTVKEIVDQLIGQGYVSGRPTLGISGESISRFHQKYYRWPSGLYITDVESGSDAGSKGVRPGDILISINGTKVTDNDTLRQLLYAYAVGDNVNAVVYRNGRQYTLQLTLTEAHG